MLDDSVFNIADVSFDNEADDVVDNDMRLCPGIEPRRTRRAVSIRYAI